MSTTTNVLITGANRGLGLGLIKKYLQLLNHNIIAFVRDPSSPSSQALSTLPTGTNTNIILVQYDASQWNSAAQAVKTLREEHKITKIDTIIANAGIAKVYPLIKDADPKDIREHFEVNVLGPVALFQATRDLLLAAREEKPERQPIYAWMGSGAGLLTGGPDVASAAYAPSKTMLNWYGMRLHVEENWLASFILDPGWVRTEMGNAAAEVWGLEHANLTVEESVDGMFEVVQGATREKFGGRLVEYTGKIEGW
ncbi:hypothetical protein QBC40DRAFT_46910 [Triangularia verruculosa]|uniref:Uncharacterized protein n=1 Tax=Triangularia verruculosa TaxID=2587418 RepID=A0AAN6XP54_9PEZI|nr:hypothetical protein QBC40DRAFT_46910 [Triangularia verruculosa]